MLTAGYYALAACVQLGVLLIVWNVACWTREAFRDDH